MSPPEVPDEYRVLSEQTEQFWVDWRIDMVERIARACSGDTPEHHNP